jgi:hypothetical protein
MTRLSKILAGWYFGLYKMLGSSYFGVLCVVYAAFTLCAEIGFKDWRGFAVRWLLWSPIGT